MQNYSLSLPPSSLVGKLTSGGGVLVVLTAFEEELLALARGDGELVED